MQFVWFCAAGYSFFLGGILLLISILFSKTAEKYWQRAIFYALTLVGCFFIFLSATPLARWFYFIWIVTLFGWLIYVSFNKKLKSTFLKWCSILVFCLTVAAMLFELSYFVTPHISEKKFKVLYIIGDSVSAGIGGGK